MSKKVVKTMNDAELERKLTAFSKNKQNGKSKSPSDVGIKPGNINLAEGKFDPKKDNRQTAEAGKIITEQDLAKEREIERKEAERFKAEFLRQYLEWKDVDEWSEYNWCEFDNQDILLRLFWMDISDFSGYVTLNYEWSSILREFKLKDVDATENVFPIAKVLKLGKMVNKDYKVGDIVLVPSSDIIGDDWNPKFLQTMQFQNSKGMDPVLPNGMKQRIPNVEIHWSRYKFVRPWVPQPEAIDNLTYIVPESKAIGSYNYGV